MSRRNPVTHLFGVLFALFLSLPVWAGKEKGEKDGAVEIDPKSQQVLERMSDFFAGLESFTVEATMDWRFEFPTGSDFRETRYEIAFERGERFAMIMDGGEVGATIVRKGKEIYAHLPQREAYAKEPATKSFADVHEALTMSAELTNMPGIAVVDTLIADDPLDVLMKDVTKVEYVGTDRYDSTNCDHIRLIRAGRQWNLWIGNTGDEAEVLRFETVLGDDQFRIGDDKYEFRTGGAESVARVAFSDWRFNKHIGNRDFKYRKPRRGQEVTSVASIKNTWPPHPLLGKEAPGFELEQLGGGRVDLDKHRGKDVVVLDFWATWCSACRAAMPTMVEVTDKFADQGVVFYAVNQRESSSEIDSFLKSAKFDLSVLLDSRGMVGQEYYARGLPQMVIIDKKGIVQVVHSGFSSQLKKQLAEELEAVLAGKKLAKKDS